MNLLKKLKSFAVLAFICGILLSVSAASCETTKANEDDSTEQPAAEEVESNEHPKEEAEHPAGEHPKSDADSTAVEDKQ